MNKKMKKLRLFRENDDAVAGIIVTVMIVGMVIAVLGIIQTVYVPQWMTEREAEHMMVVSDQISQIKHNFDNIAITQMETPVSSYVTLGSKELGFFSSARAFGYLQLIENEVSFWFDTTTQELTEDFNVLGYSSQNSYYLDQEFTFEAGALILNQEGGAVMLNPPSITIDTEYGPQETLITISTIETEPIGGVSSLGGYGTYPIHMQFDSFESNLIGGEEVESIGIKTSSPSLWEHYFDKLLTNAGYTQQDPNADYEIIVDPDEEYNVKINILSSCQDDFYVQMDVTTIDIQMAPGWI